MNRRFRNILRGAGSVLDIFPAREDVSIKTVRESKEGALAKDLRQVGKDFYVVIRATRATPEEKHGQERVVIGGRSVVSPDASTDQRKGVESVKIRLGRTKRPGEQTEVAPSPAKAVLVCSNGKGTIILGKGTNMSCATILPSEDDVFSSKKQKNHTRKLEHAL